MWVKVGNKWYKDKPGQPILVFLTDTDKYNIANMAPHCRSYAIIPHPEEDFWNEQEWIDSAVEWMQKDEPIPKVASAREFPPVFLLGLHHKEVYTNNLPGLSDLDPEELEEKIRKDLNNE